MSSDPNKKSARTFQCRDVLWETFEQMARELECSVDYLINEAMKQYARQRSYGSRTPFPGGRGAGDQGRDAGRDQGRDVGREQSRDRGDRDQGSYASGPSVAPTAVPPPPQMRAAPLGAGLGGSSSRLPPPPMRPGAGLQSGMGQTSGIGGSNLPVPPPRGGHGSHGLNAPPPRGMPAPPRSNLPPPSTRTAPPPLPRQPTPLPPAPLDRGDRGGHDRGGMGGMGSNGGYNQHANQQVHQQVHGASLNVIYQGEKLPVTKDRFVIGRGKQSSDLTLKDPNVSRQHAMIEFQNGVYFMVDMGSTNGVEYNGQRIARKQIAEGDVFKICDHDLRFTYR